MIIFGTKDIISIIVGLAKETTFSRGKLAVSVFKDKDFNINVYIMCLEGSVINHIFTIHKIKDKIEQLEYDSIICKSIAGDIESTIDSIPGVALDGKYTYVYWYTHPIVHTETGRTICTWL